MQDKLLAHEQALIQLAGRVNKVEEARVPLATQLALLGQPAPARVVEGQMNWVCPKCGARDRIASDDIADALRAARAAPTPPALDVEGMVREHIRWRQAGYAGDCRTEDEMVVRFLSYLAQKDKP
jgi:hypothetical protein